jgi:hypothetical protein
VATGLPWVELAIAVAVLLAPTAAPGAIGALVLLTLFVAGIAISLGRGRQPECRCFGQIHSAPISWKTLARNAALAGAAALVVARGPGASLGSWSSRLTGIEWLGLVVAMGLAVAVGLEGSAVRRRWRPRPPGDPVLTIIPPSSTGLPVGTPAPRLTLWVPGRPLLLIFTARNCGSCASLSPDVSRWQAERGDELTVALVFDREVARAFRAAGPPSAVVIGRDGAIASPVVEGPDPIRRLVESVLATPRPGGEV